jgi:hypothetical protein
MSHHDDFGRSLARWLEAEAQPAVTADVLDRALGATHRRRPHPRLFAVLGSHWVGERVGPSSGGATLGRRAGLRPSTALLLLLLVVALVAGAVLIGTLRIQPAPDIGRLGHLAYTLDDGLYVADWDGQNPRRIVSPDQWPVVAPEACREFFGQPTWSPDGRHLAVRTWWSDDCEGFIFITDAEGASVMTVLGAGWRIAWSPDSSRIVTWIDFLETIAVYGIDGERQALLDAPPSSGDHDPGWTPDGSAVHLLGTELPLDGSAQSVYRRAYGVMSPDGKWIARPTGSSIGVEATDGTSDRGFSSVQLVELAELVWAPASARVAFRTKRSSLGVIDVSTGATTLLDVPLGEFDLVAVSPEGDRFLLATYASVAPDGRSALWVVQSDGAGLRKLVDGTQEGDWQWLPPGAPPSVEPTAGPSLEPKVTALLNGFIEARVAGLEAEDFLYGASDAVPLLYASTSGAHYERGEFERVPGQWPYGWTAFKVRMYAGETVVEQLFFTSISGPGGLEYQYDGFRTDIAPTTEDGRPVGVTSTYFDGEVTMRNIYPWVDNKLIPEGAAPTTDGGERLGWTPLIVKVVPASCQPGGPVSAAGVAERIRSDPDLTAIPPVAVSAGGANALMMDVVTAAGTNACGFNFGTGVRTRLYLIDAPDGSSMRVLAVAIGVPESSFARAVAPANSMVDSIEFHAP